MNSGTSGSAFPIPASLQDLEHSPYNLLPYPPDFDDDDEVARADSFDNLVQLLERGNRTLIHGGVLLFEDGEEEGFEEWMSEDKIQALYTLVRKSASLAPGTRSRLYAVLCQTVHSLSNILSSPVSSSSSDGNTPDASHVASPHVMSQSFRDALSCHLYMLFSVMSAVESEVKVDKGLGGTTTSSKSKSKNSKKERERKAEAAEKAASREACASAMLAAAQAMGEQKSRLWKRGVPDETVVSLPCRIAYQMLENSINTTARKASSGDAALGIIAATADSCPSLMNTILAALMDLLHSFEHISSLVADLCTMVSEDPTNALAIELLREVGRLEAHTYDNNSGGASSKASGIKNVSQFIPELALRRPNIVLSNISIVLPLLDSEAYVLRSSIVAAIAHIVSRAGKEDENNDFSESFPHNSVNEGNGKAVGNKKNRDALLDVLTERAHDVSSYTRVAVLKAWATLTESDSLPLDRVEPVTALAIDRLQDKTVLVRRSAMQLLTLILENNPFMGSLDPAPYREKISELDKYLEENVPERFKADIKAASLIASQERKSENDDEDNNDEKKIATDEEIDSAALEAAMQEAKDINEDTDAEIDYKRKLKALKFAESTLEFITLFENANQAFECMLQSSNTSDVTEAIRFFVRARHFKLPCAVTGMKQALALMWSSEKSITDEVMRGFVDVFIAVPGTSGEEFLPENQIAHNLLALVGQSSVSEQASIEEAIRSLVKDEGIPAEVFTILWSVASKASGEGRAAALLVISMGASADPNIVDSASRLLLLQGAGLGDYVQEHRDWKTVKSASHALQQIGRAQAASKEGSAKSLILEHIVEQLCAVARGDWCADENPDDTKRWFCAAEQAINAIFTICTEPEKECAEIIRGLEVTTFGTETGNPSQTCSALRLSRFFFVIGHIAIKLLVYTESLSGFVRRANAAKSLSKQISADKAKKSNGGDSSGEDAIEAELGVAAEVEAENERKVADISEKEIVGRGLIGIFGPLLVRIVDNENGNFPSEILTQSATLALCKLMSISNSFCEKHLPLLFSALAKAPAKDTTLRANTVVALGDLAFRFPNAVEPYTPRLYACLRDNSTRVRRHTLMVLTHLILNDMVKVKGQVCEIAMCLEDEDARIRDMSRLLFHELSKRSNNPIYNLLPDIISQLSQMDIGKESFQKIMSFLLNFIKKERQNEMLVDKLCQRFPKCTSISQKAAISYCLSQLKINEKCIKLLNDQFKLYKDALFDEEVFKGFALIVAKAKSFMKSDIKESILEWEQKLSTENSEGLENFRAGNKAAKAKRKVQQKKKKKVYEGETDTDDDDNDNAEDNNDGFKENPPKTTRQKSANSRPQRRRILRSAN